MECRVLGLETDENGVVEIPEGLQPLSVIYHPVTYRLMVACIQMAEEEPEGGKVEEEAGGD